MSKYHLGCVDRQLLWTGMCGICDGKCVAGCLNSILVVQIDNFSGMAFEIKAKALGRIPPPPFPFVTFFLSSYISIDRLKYNRYNSVLLTDVIKIDTMICHICVFTHLHDNESIQTLMRLHLIIPSHAFILIYFLP